MLTLNIAPHYSVFRSMLAPQLTQDLGAGFYQTRRRFPRPVYKFTLHDDEEDKAAAEALYSFMAYHQGDIPFWYSGSQWGSVNSGDCLIGEGDGIRTHWLLPNRHILDGTLVVLVDGSSTAFSWTVDTGPGLIVLSTAPPGSLITATYACQYKCVFLVESETLLNQELFQYQLFKSGGIMLREAIP
jgi:hypothetical protein